VPNVLLIGDTARTSDLRHEIPLAVIDAFHDVELDGRRVAVVWSIEGDRIAAIDSSTEIVPAETFPADDLIRDGVDLYQIAPIQSVRIARSLGLRDGVVPEFFPLLHADALRADGVELTVDQRFFDDRRRRKSPRELEGIERASRAAEAGTAAIAALLRRSEAGDGGRSLDGEPLTCESSSVRPRWRSSPPTGAARTRSSSHAVRSRPTATTPARAGAFFEGRGHPTRKSVPEGAVLREGFNHSLAHGVGLDVHEAPNLGKIGHHLGDVITLEPGLYRHGFGGVRLEDMVLVTEDGCETITDFPTTLDPVSTVVETAG
jgi:Xaa-Pro aminopeptidase